MIASVFFLILMLLGETLQFLPSGSTPFLTCVYGAELFFVSWVLMYRSKNTVELLDFFVSAVILGCLLYTSDHQRTDKGHLQSGRWGAEF